MESQNVYQSKQKCPERQKSIFSSSKLGTMRIVVKGHDLVAQIVYDAKEDAAFFK